VTEGHRVLAVIPARGGSKGLPGKNVRPLAGLPLIAHSIMAAAMMPVVTRCVVSTDSQEIADVARAHAGDVPFLRPASLARDDTPMAPVIAHVLATIEQEEGMAYDAVLLLDPTSPSRLPDQIESAASLLFSDDRLDGVMSVSEPTFNPTWVGVRECGDGSLERYYPMSAGMTRRQDAARYLRINGNFYLWKSAFVRRLKTSWLDEGTHGGVEIPEAQAFSIDDEFEFRMIEALFVAGLIRMPWLEST
jgi:CMP-N,N'-diacetyllegionaminic acid synthase